MEIKTLKHLNSKLRIKCINLITAEALNYRDIDNAK